MAILRIGFLSMYANYACKMNSALRMYLVQGPL